MKKRSMILTMGLIVLGLAVTSCPNLTVSTSTQVSSDPAKACKFLFDKGQYQQAVLQCEAALDKKPHDYYLLGLTALCYYMLEDYNRAIDLTGTCLEYTPEVYIDSDPDQFNHCYHILFKSYLAVEEYRPAMRVAEAVADREPESYWGYLFIGMTYFEERMLNQALEAFHYSKTKARPCRDLDDLKFECYINDLYIARCHLLLKEYDEALEYYQLALEKSNNDKDIKTEMQVVEKMARGNDRVGGLAPQPLGILKEMGR